MEQSVQNTPDYASPEYAAKVVADLTALQDKNRLAIHQWEGVGGLLLFSEPTLLAFDNAANEIRPRLQNGVVLPTASLTLLPPSTALYSVLPYEINDHTLPGPGYLVNMRQDTEHPPLVIRASICNLISGSNIYGKKLNLTSVDDKNTPELEAMYAGKLTDKLKKSVGDNPALSAQQLDILGKYLNDPEVMRLYEDRDACDVAKHNEVIAALSKDHICAISLPVYDGDTTTAPYTKWRVDYADMNLTDRQAVRELSAALCGLEHLQNGMDLPVVFYHVDGPQKGHITYLGQGKDMLMEKAFAAIKTLQDHQIALPLQALDYWDAQDAQRLLGVRITMPLEEQSAYKAFCLARAPETTVQAITKEEIALRGMGATWGVSF